MKARSKINSVGDIRRLVVPVLRKYGVKKAGVFGSYAREDAGEDSDLDLLVELDKSLSLLDVIGIKQEIEGIVGRKVDLVEYNLIKPVIRNRIIREEVALI